LNSGFQSVFKRYLGARAHTSKIGRRSRVRSSCHLKSLGQNLEYWGWLYSSGRFSNIAARHEI
jgi:hypothetical protein